MAGPRSGLNSQLMIAEETTWGTGVTPTLGVPMISESIGQTIDRLESKGIIAGARALRSQQWAAGNQYVKGSLALELYDRSTSLLFKHMFGSVSTSGSGPYTHTFTPGDLRNLGLTIQIGRPDNSGTVQPFTYAGSKIGKWSLGLKADEIATLGLDIVAKSETTATALAAASYTSGIAPITFNGASLTIAGSGYKVNAVNLSGDNKLDDKRIFISQSTIDEPYEIDLREYTGTLDSEFVDLTAYNRFVNGTEAALVLSMAKGTSTATITMNVRFDGQTPNVAGGAILRQPLPFKAVGSSTDASAITAVLVNGDATP